MKVKSTIFSVMRGSLAGTTYTANTYANIVGRNRTIPVNPKTGPQTVARTAFAQASAAWNALTDAKRSSWADWAQTVTRTGPLGPYSPKARSLAMAIYSFVLLMDFRFPSLGIVPDMEPPTTAGELTVGQVAAFPPSATGTGYSIQGVNNLAEDIYFAGWRSVAQNAARFFYNGPFIATANGVIPITAGASDNIEFTGLPDTVVYFNRCRACSQESPFRISPEYIVRAVSETIV
jgi:hypothetical protein